MFTRTFHVRWGDMDFNAHMRNTAYLDTAADVRMMFFEEGGFTMREFDRLRIGPVIMRDEIDYHRELRLLDKIEVTLELAGLADDGSRVRLCNVFHRADGKVAGRVTSHLGWLDRDARKLVAPPEPLLELLRAIHRTADFEILRSSLSAPP